MDEASVRATLVAARTSQGRPLVLYEEMTDVVVEGNWVALAVARDGVETAYLEALRRAAKAAFPEAHVEVRHGLRVHRGGLGFGEGKHVIAVMGGKGGVGKSTVALNLALTFAAMGMRTGLLDGDLAGPDIPHMLGIHPMRVSSTMPLMTSHIRKPSQREQPQKRYEMEVVSVGFALPERRWPAVMGHNFVALLLRYLLFEVNWSADVVIIDAPPGTGSELQVMAKDLPLSGVLFVTTPQDLAQMDAGRTLTLLQDSGVPVIGMVQNMAFMNCPHCGETIDMFARSKRLEDEGLRVVGRIPFDVSLARAADDGLPLVLGDPTGPVAYEFARIGAGVRRWLRDDAPKVRERMG
jgi:ATP-binding protein involved in chromosome partitioning